MKVSKEMLHPSLQSIYGILRFQTWVMKRTALRNFFDKLVRKLTQGKDLPGLACDERYIDSSEDEYKIRVRTYRPEGDHTSLPAMIYIHGGGYVMGLPESGPSILEQFIAARPCMIIAPDYRKAGSKPYPAGLNDCYDTLLWAKNNADELGIRADRFMIAGHSAGGGLTAAVTLKARDTGEADIAFQMPIYPMIDDQQPTDPNRAVETVVWDTELNAIGWNAYLADLREAGAEIPAYAAPARNHDYQGFPPTITFVGDMEPFHRETVEYVGALEAAGIDVAFKEFQGCFHAFDFFNKEISQEAVEFTYGQFREFYDRYVR